MKTINGMNYYTLFEVAEKLQVHPHTVRKIVTRGDLPTINIGYVRYVTETALNEYLGVKQTA